MATTTIASNVLAQQQQQQYKVRARATIVIPARYLYNGEHAYVSVGDGSAGKISQGIFFPQTIGLDWARNPFAVRCIVVKI